MTGPPWRLSQDQCPENNLLGWAEGGGFPAGEGEVAQGCPSPGWCWEEASGPCAPNLPEGRLAGWRTAP